MAGRHCARRCQADDAGGRGSRHPIRAHVPIRLRAILGAAEGDDAPLVLLGHEMGPLGRRIPWLRVAHLDEPAAWCRDPSGGGSSAPG